MTGEVIQINAIGSIQNGFFIPFRGNPELLHLLVNAIDKDMMLPVVTKNQNEVIAEFYGDIVSVHYDHCRFL